MTTARQLRETGTDLERALLSAGAAERPDAASVRRAAKVLGVVPRAALIAATLGIALRATRWTSVAAWGTVPLVGLVGVALVAHRNPAPPSAPAATPAAAPAQAAPAPRIPETTATPAAVEPSGSPRVATRKGAPMAVAAGDSLREQASALDGVRELLALGEPNSALSHLDAYDHRFASGPLREESQLLRIEALARQGDRAAATSLARRFLKVYPASVHVDRVAALVQSMTP